jgi:CRISPR/Cas system CMR-associated protein Cmr1 (group 7 of RAMP superfamily)
MKKFKDMTSEEIAALSNEEFNKISPFDKHSCYDCLHLKGFVNIWCTNREAIQYRGTAIPGIIKCTFWSPNWDYIDDAYKTPENGFKPKKSNKNIFRRIFSK